MPRGTPSWRPSASARRSRSGAAIRSRSSRSRSRARRRRGSRSCTSPASRRGSTPTSIAGVTPSSSPSSSCWSRATRCARACARSSCSRSTAPAASPRRSRPTRRSARASRTSSGSSRRRALKELERQILRQDPGLDLDAPAPRCRQSSRRRTCGTSRAATSRSPTRWSATGPVDLVLVHGWVCSFQPGWERPQIASFYNGLASIGRLIQFDKRGTGLSDRVVRHRPARGADGRRARGDGRRRLGAGRPARRLGGRADGHALRGDLSRSARPASSSWASYARRQWAPDYPIGRAARGRVVERPDPEAWGLPMARRFVDERAPSLAGDEDTYRWYASYLVRGASPGAAAQLARMNAEIDVRHVLPVDPRADARALPARRVPPRRPPATWASASPARGSSRCREPTTCRGRAHRTTCSREIEQFVAQLHAEPEPDRVLATVLVVEADGTEEACDADPRRRRPLPRDGARAHDGHADRHVRRPGTRDPLRIRPDDSRARGGPAVARGPPHRRARARRRPPRRHPGRGRPRP